ncbi:MAG TPA: type I 3-dehydroquinate dehydratase [Euryarchaeota archaeon]|nr:type I 3-dehydroquinate dehydratase [Euryarchaeota archaeon]
MPAICASIMEESVEGFLKAASGVKADLIEVRADGLSEPTAENVHHLLSELKKTTQTRTILTVRKKDEGGRFEGTEDERKNVILGSLHLADIIDIELNSPIRDEIVLKARANRIEVIVSYHDFEKTPETEEITGIFESEAAAGADYAKAAFKANNPSDVLRLLDACQQMKGRARVIAISMGELGSISRIAAPVFGSAITYASLGAKTAPGQLTVEETKTAFKMLGVSR